jgi:putative transposase
MSRKRRSFTPSFKTKVALEALRENKTISEIAQRHKLHPTQINLWKKQLLEGAEEVFQDERSRGTTVPSDESESAEL